MGEQFYKLVLLSYYEYPYFGQNLKDFMTTYTRSIEFAREKDANDPLKSYRDQFYIPVINGIETVYFTGIRWGYNQKHQKLY